MKMSRAMRRKLGISRRIPDTTLRNTAVKLNPEEFRKALRRQTKAAHKRKALMSDGFPFGAVAIDGHSPDSFYSRTNKTEPMVQCLRESWF